MLVLKGGFMKTIAVTIISIITSLLMVGGCGGIKLGVDQETIDAAECIADPAKCKNDSGSTTADDSGGSDSEDGSSDGSSSSAGGSHDTSGGVQDFDGYDRD